MIKGGNEVVLAAGVSALFLGLDRALSGRGRWGGQLAPGESLEKLPDPPASWGALAGAHKYALAAISGTHPTVSGTQGPLPYTSGRDADAILGVWTGFASGYHGRLAPDVVSALAPLDELRRRRYALQAQIQRRTLVGLVPGTRVGISDYTGDPDALLEWRETEAFWELIYAVAGRLAGMDAARNMIGNPEGVAEGFAQLFGESLGVLSDAIEGFPSTLASWTGTVAKWTARAAATVAATAGNIAGATGAGLIGAIVTQPFVLVGAGAVAFYLWKRSNG